MPRRITLALILLISLPYLIALLAAGPDAIFGGFLMNPADGNSYLAKMRQGWSGNWRFTLTYTSESGQGAFLYTFYLFLGHVARWLGISLPLVFHIARLLGAVAMACMIWRFYSKTIPKNGMRTGAYAAACLGLGMGWLLFPFGIITADFWVAEAYPFLSGYVNPHFAFSLALLLWLLLPGLNGPGTETESPEKPLKLDPMHALLIVFASAWLGSMSPFMVVLALGIMGGLSVWELIAGKDIRRILPLFVQTIWTALGGVPVILYITHAVKTDRILAAWNTQNLTPSPPVWDLVLAFSPVLLFAVPGAWQAVCRGRREGRLLVVWVALAIGLVYAPFGLQRRFLAGVYVPLTVLSAYGIDYLASRLKKNLFAVRRALFALVLPSTLLILLIGQFGVFTRDPLFYISDDEARAFQWLRKNVPPDALVLAGPRIGMFLPAWTGRRVIYGHPFETMNASAEKEAVQDFFRMAAADSPAARAFLIERGIDYIFYGSDERRLGTLDFLSDDEVFSSDGVIIYQMDSS